MKKIKRSSIPDDIIVEILSWLPAKSLLRFRCVCKPWCNLITSNPNFVKIHLNHAIEKECNLMLSNCGSISSIDLNNDDSLSCYYEATEINDKFRFRDYDFFLGSCNGLLCINVSGVDNSERMICLLNPCTREFKEIPSTHEEFPSGLDIQFSKAVYGFGYDSKIEDYKLVKIVTFYRTEYECGCIMDVSYAFEAKVYTLRSNSWKTIPYTIPYDVIEYHDQCPHGVLVSGSLHWIAVTRIGGYEAYNAIVSFDIGEERFAEVPQLEHLDAKFFRSLTSLGGCLCVLGDSYQVGVEVWVMKDYGVRDSWTKLFFIAQQSILGSFRNLRPLWYFKNGKILLDFLSEDCDHSLLSYDLKHERAKFLKIRSGPKQWSEIETYVESLVSLHSGNYIERASRGRFIKHEDDEENEEAKVEKKQG